MKYTKNRVKLTTENFDVIKCIFIDILLVIEKRGFVMTYLVRSGLFYFDSNR